MTSGPATTPRLDPRVARTRVLLQDALLELARERGLDAISVADIADRATVNRSTFYQHYADKETLLADALDEQALRAGADLTALLADDAAASPDRVAASAPEALARYTAHVAENADLYRRALAEGGSPIAVARLRRRIVDVALQGLRRHGAGRLEGLPPEIAASAFAGSLLGVLTAWLELEPLPPSADAARWAWAALSGGVESGGVEPE